MKSTKILYYNTWTVQHASLQTSGGNETLETSTMTLLDL